MKLLQELLDRFRRTGSVISEEEGSLRLRSEFSGVRAIQSRLPKSRLRELAYAAGIPEKDSGLPGAWQDDDAARVVMLTFTDESADRHGTVFPASEWTFENYMRNPVCLLNHGGEFPLGTTLLIQPKRVRGADGVMRPGWSAHVLFSREELNPDAEMAYRNVMAGRLRGVSHSFDPKRVYLADEEQAKKLKVARGTPVIHADLMEISPVLIGSNPNAGPGRGMGLVQARALASFRTEEGAGLLSRDAISALYGDDIAEEVESDVAEEILAGEAPADVLERAAAAVDSAFEESEFEPTVLDVEDAEDDNLREFEPTALESDSPEDALAALFGDGDDDLEDQSSREPESPEEIQINGVTYRRVDDADKRRARVTLLAARALASAVNDDADDFQDAIADCVREEINDALQPLREAVAAMQDALVAVDPLGESGNGDLVGALLGEEFVRVAEDVAGAIASD